MILSGQKRDDFLLKQVLSIDMFDHPFIPFVCFEGPREVQYFWTGSPDSGGIYVTLCSTAMYEGNGCNAVKIYYRAFEEKAVEEILLSPGSRLG